MSARKAWLVGADEFAELYGAKRQALDSWRRRGDLTTDEARIVSGTPYWPLGYALEWGRTTKRRRVADAEVAKRIEAEQGDGILVARAADVPPVAGLREAAQIVGWADLSANAMRAKGKMPAADYPALATPVWLLDTLVLWAQARGGEYREDVVEALREGRYDGPGSQILRRGARAAAGPATPEKE